MKKMKVAAIFGTRPEAIKLAPVIAELKRFPQVFQVTVVVSGQHRQMLDQALTFFKIKPDYDLKIMQSHQTLFGISKKILAKMGQILKLEKPDLSLIQGDTPTAFIAALASFYCKIPIAHIEAGLRTYDKYNPFPEEINRKLIDDIADLYFAPTEEAKNNLLKEGKNFKTIWVTGNTGIDALVFASKKAKGFLNGVLTKIDFKNKKIVLLTCHRRESWGKKIEEIFKGVKLIIDEFDEVEVIFPIHLNKEIRKPAIKVFGNHPKIYPFDPLDYPDMATLLKNCFLVATDSGGLQEEAPYFGKPVVVLRDITERVEGLRAGTLIIGGTSCDGVYNSIKQLIMNKSLYNQMSKAKNPYGDGKASIRIRKAIVEYFNLRF